MRICFVMIVFQADHTLESCLKSLLPFGPVVATEGPVKFWRQRGYMQSMDHTIGLLRKYKIPTTCGQWEEKDEMVQEALGQVPKETDFIFFVDADEIWDPRVLDKVLAILESDSIDSMSFKPWSFYGGFDRIMGGFEEDFEWHRVSRVGRFKTHRPPTLLAEDGRPWRAHRHMNHLETSRLGLRFHHYSYVFPSQMLMKAEYYHSRGGTIPDYFNRVYLPWVCGDSVQREKIEDLYNGVHDWLPARRGSCRTRLFEGAHPPEIAACLSEMRARFRQELEDCR